MRSGTRSFLVFVCIAATLFILWPVLLSPEVPTLPTQVGRHNDPASRTKGSSRLASKRSRAAAVPAPFANEDDDFDSSDYSLYGLDKDLNLTERLERWHQAAFGMFIHWGAYSEGAGIWRDKQIPDLGEQLMRFAEIPQNEYEELPKRFNPVEFNPDEWVALAKDAGMKYIVITAKHHDGFALFKSKQSDYNMVDFSPYGKDLIKMLADACERAKLGFGLYFSNPDWHYPKSITRSPPNKYSVFDRITDDHHKYTLAQLEEVLTGYGPLVEIFFDMGSPSLQQSKDWVAQVRKFQPGCLVNGRVMNAQGDFLTMPDNAVPDETIDQAWEAPSTLYNWAGNELKDWNNWKYDTWGYKEWIPRPDLETQVRKQIRKMVRVVSRGGNFLLNVGPTGKGSIIEYEQDVLRKMGQWMKVNGESIYGVGSDPFKRLPFGHCTVRDDTLYFHVLDWPADGQLLIRGLASAPIHAYILADKSAQLSVLSTGKDTIIDGLPSKAPDAYDSVIAVVLGQQMRIIDPVVRSDGINAVTLTAKLGHVSNHYHGMHYYPMTPYVRVRWEFLLQRSGKYTFTLWASKRRNEVSEAKIILRVGEPGAEETKEFTIAVDKENALGIFVLPKSDRLVLEISSPDPSKSIAVNVDKIYFIHGR
eukprot:TRINITY_DN6338_c0_g1_i1.p1 TRINITY_DN6338_c0_g1~~TRINITY_DN6338_c0_g1_i1.p1  ORF type:complete len:645 (-),score=261.18 TRINITY_DN6338_c0_g1_i1:614-2548(-)